MADHMCTGDNALEWEFSDDYSFFRREAVSS